MAKKKFDFSNLESGADLFADEIETKKTEKKSFDEIAAGDTLFNGVANKDNLRPEKITVAKLIESKNNPYKVITDNEEFETLLASIKEEGIISPLIARPLADGNYEIISGHRRIAAARELGLKKVPVVVKTLSDAEAAKLIVDANLNRESITVGEKAHAIKLKYDAVRQLVKERLEKEGEGGDSASLIADEMGMSRATVTRNLRLAELIDDILDAIEEKVVNLKAGVELSYLAPGVQKAVIDAVKEDGLKINEAAGKKIRESFKGVKKATSADVKKALSGKKKAQTPLVSTAALKKEFFPRGTSNDEVNKVIKELLASWKKANNK